jgi:hypothetical protein
MRFTTRRGRNPKIEHECLYLGFWPLVVVVVGGYVVVCVVGDVFRTLVYECK